jgi:hypothetical protein
VVITNGGYSDTKRCLDTHRTSKSWVMSFSLADANGRQMVRREGGIEHVHHLRLLTCEGIGFKKLIPPRFAGAWIVGGRR